MYLLVGLGNPTKQYEKNRHNIGFMAADAIAREYNFGTEKQKLQGLYREGEINGEKCLLLKPQTYMNESGRSVGGFATFFKIPPKNIIVYYDELELEPGRCRLKTGGGTAGHNGLKSISAQLGSDYRRVRLGIGHPGKEKVTGHVLSDFSSADFEWVNRLCEAVAKNTKYILSGESDKFQTETHKMAPPPPVPSWLRGGKSE